MESSHDRQEGEGLGDAAHDGDGDKGDDRDEGDEGGEEDDADVQCGVLPKSSSPLPECIEDWPVPDDRLFKQEQPPMLPGRPTTTKMHPPGTPGTPGAAAPPQPVSHRPVPDDNGLYPEEVASLRALGLRPLDLEAIGVNLSSAATPGGGGALALLPMDALAAVRQAQAAQKKTHKQVRGVRATTGTMHMNSLGADAGLCYAPEARC